MTAELWILAGAVLLGLVHISVQSFAYKAQVGNAYTVGARDEPRPATGLAGRLERASRNFAETFPLYAALVLIVHVSGTGGAISLAGGVLFLAGRILFLPAYALGLVWVRTLLWNLSMIGLVLVAVELFADFPT